MSSSVWYLSFSKKKIEFKKYSVKQKNKKSFKKSKQTSSKIKKVLLGLMLSASLILFLNLISAAAINDSFHLNIQTTFSNGSIQEGTFTFGFNITESSSSSCLATIVYNHSTQKTTDSRGIVSIYLPSVGSNGGNLSSLNFDKQYYLCYYRDGTLKDVSQLGRVPYSFRATQVNLSEISVDSNLNISNFNITNVNHGFFSSLGSFLNRITSLFVQDINASGNLDVGGDINFTGLIYGNGSQLTNIIVASSITWANAINGTLVENNTGGWEINVSIIDATELRSDDWTNVTITESQISDLFHNGTTDTNETTRVNNLNSTICDKVVGAFANASFICGVDSTGSSANIFDQVLNMSSNVTFFNVTATGNISARSFFLGDGSRLTGIVHTTDTNETTRFNRLNQTDCGGTDKVRGVNSNGTLICDTDATGSSANIFDQVLNTTSNVTHFQLNVTDSVGTSLIPFADSLFNLGSGAVRWLTGFFDRVVADTGNFTNIYADDWSNFTGTSSQITNFNLSLDSYNTSLKNYLDTKDISFNDSIVVWNNNRFVTNVSLNSTVCDKVVSSYSNGSFICGVDQTGSSANIFNQVLNTTSNVTFFNLSISRNLSVDTNTLFVDSNSNRVGIGTASPKKGLHIQNTTTNEEVGIRVDSGGATEIYLVANDSKGLVGIGYPSGNLSIRRGTFGSDVLGTGIEVMRLTSSGNVGIGTTNPQQTLNVIGEANVTGALYIGELGTNVLSTIQPVYIRGTGLNHGGNRLVKIGNITHVDGSGRGLTLTIFTASNHSLFNNTNFDTFGSSTASDSLATALNNLQRSQIGVLTSNDAWEGQVTANLRTAARRLGLFRLGAYSSGGSRRPYAAIFYGSGTATGNTEPGRQAIEVMESDDADAPFALISTWLIEDSFTNQNLPNALVSANSGTVEPELIVDSSGNIGIGTINPQQKLNVVGVINATQTIFSQGRNLTLGYDYALNATEAGANIFDQVLNTTSNVTFFNLSISRNFSVNTNTLFVDSNSNRVGIGMVSPATQLDVLGTATSGKSLQLRSGDTSIGTDSTQIILSFDGGDTSFAHSIKTRHQASSEANNAIDFYLWDFGTDTSTTLGTKRVMTIEGTGNVGIGTSSPDTELDINGGLHVGTIATVTASTGRLTISGSGGEIDLQDRGSSTWSTTDRWAIYHNANVLRFFRNGADRATLNTVGDLQIDGNLSVDGTGDSYIQGNVGINTTSPDRNLQIAGSEPYLVLEETDASADNGKWGFTASAEGLKGEANSDDFGSLSQWLRVDRTGITIDQVLFPNGDVGIGTLSPGSRLEIENIVNANDVLLLQDSSGTCEAEPTTTGLTWSCSSDERLKMNIRDASPVMNFFENFRIRDYTVRKTGEEATGIIAQEVMETHPELVSEGDDGYLMASEPNPWQVVKAIQEQQTQIEELKAEIEELKKNYDILVSLFK